MKVSVNETWVNYIQRFSWCGFPLWISNQGGFCLCLSPSDRLLSVTAPSPYCQYIKSLRRINWSVATRRTERIRGCNEVEQEFDNAGIILINQSLKVGSSLSRPGWCWWCWVQPQEGTEAATRDGDMWRGIVRSTDLDISQHTTECTGPVLVSPLALWWPSVGWDMSPTLEELFTWSADLLLHPNPSLIIQ